MSKDDLIDQLVRLSALGDPVNVMEFPPDSGVCYASLKSGGKPATSFKLEPGTDGELPWFTAWQIIGCLVCHAALTEGLEHSSPTGGGPCPYTCRDELLEAAKRGLDDVLEVRLRQHEVTGKVL